MKKAFLTFSILSILISVFGQNFPDTIIQGRHFYNGSPSTFMVLPTSTAVIDHSWVRPSYGSSYNNPTSSTGVYYSSTTNFSHRLITQQGTDCDACYQQGSQYIDQQILPQAWDSDVNPGTFVDTVIQIGSPGSQGKKSQQIEYCFIPDNDNPVLLLNFMFVLENKTIGSHNYNTNPRIDIEMLDGITNQRLNLGYYPVGYPNAAPGAADNPNWPYSRLYIIAPGDGAGDHSQCTPVTISQHECPISHAIHAGSDVQNVVSYQYTITAFNLKEQALAHTPVKLKLMVRACDYSAHWAYCYYTVKMVSGKINMETFAGEDSIHLSVPWGFNADNYIWYNGPDSLNYNISTDAENSAGYPYHVSVLPNTLNPYWRCEAVSETGIPIVFETTIDYATNETETQVACDSYTWHGHTYTTSGTYTYTYTDSLAQIVMDTLHLIINHGSTSEITVNCAEDCYTWNNVIYCESGDYVQTFTNSQGCDSVVMLHLNTGQLLPISTYSAIGMRPDTLISRHFSTNGIPLYNGKWNWSTSAIYGTQIGFFSNTNSQFPLSSGIIMATGNIDVAPGPNTSASASNSSGVTSATIDSELSELANGRNITTTNVLEFDFQATSDTFAFNYIFASEEYPEYVNSQFNDIFAIFLRGLNPYTGIISSRNVAIIPNSISTQYPNGIPVSINNLNDHTNQQFYISNTDNIALQYDGFTVPMVVSSNLSPCHEYHLKLSIANVGDQAYDSGLFLEKGSFYIPHTTISDYSAIHGNDTIVKDVNTKTINLKYSEPTLQTLTFIVESSENSTAEWGTDFIVNKVYPDGSTYSITPGSNVFTLDVGDTLCQINIAVAPTAIFEEEEVKTVELILTQELCDNFVHLDNTSEPLYQRDTFLLYLANSIATPSDCHSIDVVQRNIYLAPNPASNSVTVMGVDPSQIKEIAILTIDGKLVRRITEQTSQIDISDLAKTVFIVRIISQDGKISYTKLVKQ